MVFNCCVKDCKNYNKDAQMHVFPKDQTLFEIWIDKIGRADLKEKPKERVRKSYRVCNVHFGPEARYVGTRNRSTLNVDAIPTLFIGTCREEVSMEVCQPALEADLPEQRVNESVELFNDMPLKETNDVKIYDLPSPNAPNTLKALNGPEATCTPNTINFPNKDKNIAKEVNYVNSAKPSLMQQMDQIKTIYNSFHRICRVCFNSSNLQNVDDLELQLQNFVKDKDVKNMPKQLCNECFTQLRAANLFLTKVNASTEFLIQVTRLCNFSESIGRHKEDGTIDRMNKNINESNNKTERKPLNTKSNKENIKCDAVDLLKDALIYVDKDEPINTIEIKGINEDAITEQSAETNVESVENLLNILNEDQNLSVKASTSLKPKDEYKVFFVYRRNDFTRGEGKPIKQISRKKENCVTCKICGANFPYIKYLRDHIIQDHTRDKSPSPRIKRLCDICGKVVANIESHIETHYVLPKFKCPYCNVKKATKTSVRFHIIQAHKEHKFLCEYCSKSFAFQSSLKRHVQVCHSTEKYTCTICSKSLKTEKGWQEHLNSHTGEKPYKCKYCGAAFSTSGIYRRHIIAWHEEQPKKIIKDIPFKCNVCQKTFLFEKNFFRHNLLHHPTAKRLFKCQSCDKNFLRRSDFSRHVKSHEGVPNC